MSLLSRKDTASMRGVAIFFIVVHNLIHWVHPITENEFSFNIDSSKAFVSHLCALHPDLWKDVFSFLGWYGVSVFLFISGYGLVCKYEKGNETDTISYYPFIKSHVGKLFFLMLIPYLLYLLLRYIFSDSIEPIGILAQLTMLSNLRPRYIDPGVYWYFGLMVQFYLFYLFFLYNRKITKIVYWNIISIISMLLFINVPADTLMSDFLTRYPYCLDLLRHNFIGWILPFTFGIIYARLDLSITFDKQWINWLSLFACITLLILANLNVYCWLLSPVFGIMSAIYFCRICNSLPLLNKVFIYFGGISAFLFAVHPVVRYVCLYLSRLSGFTASNIFTVCSYFIVCVLVAVGYKFLHKKLFASR